MAKGGYLIEKLLSALTLVVAVTASLCMCSKKGYCAVCIDGSLVSCSCELLKFSLRVFEVALMLISAALYG